MANNYVMASFEFDCGTQENAITVLHWLNLLSTGYDPSVDDEPDGWQELPEEVRKSHEEHLYFEGCFENTSPTHIAFYHDESIDIERAAQVMQAAMIHLPGVPEGQGFERVATCDKARIGEFVGGAMFVTKTQIRGASTSTLLESLKRAATEVEKKLDALRKIGFVVGLRDPRLNRKYLGSFMVVQGYEEDELPTDDGSNGPWCIVGDDLAELIEEAWGTWQPELEE